MISLHLEYFSIHVGSVEFDVQSCVVVNAEVNGRPSIPSYDTKLILKLKIMHTVILYDALLHIIYTVHVATVYNSPQNNYTNPTHTISNLSHYRGCGILCVWSLLYFLIRIVHWEAVILTGNKIQHILISCE